MKKAVLLVILLFKVCAGFAQHYNETYGKPLVVLIITDPWLMVIGSDVPAFALYDNGQIIYKKIEDGHLKYYECKTDREKPKLILSKLNITDSIYSLPQQISASTFTDQPNNQLILNFDSVKMINVYGNLRNTKSRANTPKSFLSVFDAIANFKSNDVKEWLPDSVEVMLSGYSYAPEKSLQWPKDWPDLKDKTTVKRSDDLYSVYLDKKYFEDFKKLLASMKEKQAVEVNGQKFSVQYRLPFPNIR